LRGGAIVLFKGVGCNNKNKNERRWGKVCIIKY